MSQGPLYPNLSQKVQKEVSQMANCKLSCAMLYRWFKCKLKPPKNYYYGCGCCDMDQSDTIGKIELFPSIVLSSDNTDCKNDIQLFPQLFDELSVHTDYH